MRDVSDLRMQLREVVMYELYAGTMPICASCLDGQHDCPDLMWSEVYGLYACGCEGC